jgi:hypothetical protein
MKKKVDPQPGDVLRFDPELGKVLDSMITEGLVVKTDMTEAANIDLKASYVVILIEKKDYLLVRDYCVVMRRLTPEGRYDWDQPVVSFKSGSVLDSYAEVVGHMNLPIIMHACKPNPATRKF